MRWFKHFSRAHRDTKIKRIINEFGAEGYAVYFYCLELVSDTLESDNITFEIEDDAELIGQYLRMDSVKVAKVLQALIRAELFSISESGRIACLKMAKFLDERFTRNEALKLMIKSEKMQDLKVKLSKDKHKTIRDNPVKIRLDDIRQDERRKDELIPAPEIPARCLTDHYLECLELKGIKYIPGKGEYINFTRRWKEYREKGATIEDIKTMLSEWFNRNIGEWCGYKLGNFWGDIGKIQLKGTVSKDKIALAEMIHKTGGMKSGQ